ENLAPGAGASLPALEGVAALRKVLRGDLEPQLRTHGLGVIEDEQPPRGARLPGGLPFDHNERFAVGSALRAARGPRADARGIGPLVSPPLAGDERHAV